MELSNKVFGIILFPIVISGFLIGKNIFSPPDLEQVENLSEEITIQSIDKKINLNEDNNKKEVKVYGQLKAKGKSVIVPGKIGKLLDARKLTPFYQSLKPFFPKNKTGQELLEYATILEFHVMQGTDIADYAQEKIDYLNAHPIETIENLKLVFDKLPNKFANEKQRLLQFTSKLNTNEEVRIDFLLNETKRPLPRNSEGDIEGTSLFNTTIAFRSLANVIGDKPEELKPHLMDALESHQNDPETSMALIHFYSRYDQQEALRLKEKYSISNESPEDE